MNRKPFRSYLAAALYCQSRGIDLARIVARGLYDFRIVRSL